MKNAYLELCELILERKLSSIINNDFDVISMKVEEYNTKLNLKADSRKFIAVDFDVPLSPVPLASTSSNPKIGFIGLNPKYDKGEAANEKRKGGDSWYDHADFYNSDEVFRYVIKDKKSKYYQKQIKFLYALLNPEASDISISGIRTKLEANEYEIFKSLTSDCPVMFCEFIPFHSESFVLDIKKVKKILNDIPGFSGYLKRMFEVLSESIPKEGLIIVDGSIPTSIFLELERSELKLVHKGYSSKRPEPIYEIYEWNDRFVLLAYSVICGSGTDLCDLNIVKQLTSDIRKYTLFNHNINSIAMNV